jgi:hypothetical protein
MGESGRWRWSNEVEYRISNLEGGSPKQLSRSHTDRNYQISSHLGIITLLDQMKKCRQAYAT